MPTKVKITDNRSPLKGSVVEYEDHVAQALADRGAGEIVGGFLFEQKQAKAPERKVIRESKTKKL